ncbi:EAL domain-containing protein [Duganella sp. BJB488]|uniref:putative bifunctional diguanylate cyclase/phosphodiesterase n=1 Tax=unclassified Duganella TaxID=2636909 RepID=UPI000E349944|nr:MULTISPECIES: EAL domain-containing protein [unclassified Duganella]NVD73433.1 EAL domain-containing protein [Duganella sp. BJB1802]RFP21822.1 EAL domain-containing protein [Duganella sp. BJB489]RFP23616.1 EAL domain-containing protein [Duganella sp. BJB488]RFP38782.1 EAL domain-containing protein [Duganella sp. BJB480]
MPPPITPLEQSKDDHDDLVFLEEHPATPAVPGARNVWRVMIIDDDEDVHSTTTFALGNLDMQQRPLEFVHAYSAGQARELLKHESEIAVILLDVVMEQDDAGLHLVRYIRETLNLADVRIILRTGQPGYAPEIDAIRDFDINDYKTKSELTRIKLYTTVTAAIRSYEQIRKINDSRRGLNQIVHASTQLMALHGVQNFASGVLAQIADLLGQDGNGVLCVQECPEDGCHQLMVMATIGSYRHLDNATLCNQDHKPIYDAMELTLGQRRNIYGPDFITLYFAGKASRDFVAYLDVGRAPTEIDERLLEVFCSNVAVGLDNVELVTHLHNAAFYDQLSKLPNRTRLVEILDATLAGPARDDATLSLVDLDHFAETNDALGHQFGDMLLVAVAGRLQTQLGDRLTVARIGGDIFCVLGDSSQVNPANILALFADPFSIDGQDVQLSATLGLVRLGEHEGSGADALKDADIALKRAKSQQRAGHFYFSRSMGVEIRERVRMMHALRTAFGQNQLFVVYQPQIDLATRRPMGAEALLRWQTPDGKFISPDRFIPIAEYSGLIIDLGAWVMRTACQELVDLRKAGHLDFMMSINVSQVQFRHPHFLETLRKALDDTGAPPEYVELEITESMAMEEPDMLIKMLGQIKQTGVSIAIDDFGTGFSSLSYLQRLQIDRLKIDRAFVTEITGSARGSSIAEMVIQLGRNLGLAVIAEGVEDERQAQILQALGCPLAQGFLFARPMTATALNGWLNNDTLEGAA